MTDHFEGKLHAYRRTQEGAVISFVIHPDDIRKVTDLSAKPFGTRCMIAVAEIGDDEQPAEPEPLPSEKEELRQVAIGKRQFNELPLVTQCAMRCGDARFAAYMDHTFGFSCVGNGNEYTACAVRDQLSIESRTELGTNPDGTPINEKAAEGWKVLEAGFQRWLTDQRYSPHLMR